MAKRTTPSREPAGETVTSLSFSDTLNAYEAQAIVTSDAGVDLAIHGCLCLLVGRHLAPDGMRDTVSNILDTLRARVVRVRKARGQEIKDQMLAIYVRTAHDLYKHIVGERHDNFGGVVAAVATAKTVPDALAGMKAWAQAELAADQALSLNALRKYLGHGTGRNDPKSPAEKLKSAIVSARKAVDADKVKPEVLAAVTVGLGMPDAIIRANIQALVALGTSKAMLALETIAGEADKAFTALHGKLEAAKAEAKAKASAKPELQADAH